MTGKKKILYVITKSVWGGAQRYIFDLATNLPKDEFEIVVAAGGSGPLFEKLQKAGIHTVTIPGLQRDINIWKELFSIWHLFKIFLEEKPDIIHLNSTKVGSLGAVTSKFSSLVVGHKSLVIFTVHGWGFKEDRPVWQKALIFFFSWLSSLFQDKIILINTPDYRTAQRFIPKRKLTLIHNGIGPINFFPREEARTFFTKKVGRPIASDTILIGTNAELTQNKGLSYLIDALSRRNLYSNYGGFASIVIGNGENRSELQAQIAKLGLRDKIFLLGFLPDAARYLKGFDLFVLPSLKEGLPYTIIEAMSAGLPIVASRVGGTPDLVTDGKNGLLVEIKNSIALADALEKLVKNPVEITRMGEESLKIAKNRFQLQDMIEKTSALYDS